MLVNVFKLYNKYSWVSYRHLGLVFSLAHFGMSILVVFQFVVVQTLYVVSAVSVQRYSIWDVFGFDLLLGLNGMSAGFILLSSFIFLTCSVSL